MEKRSKKEWWLKDRNTVAGDDREERRYLHQKFYNSRRWQMIREVVLALDNSHCSNCHNLILSTSDLEIHHVNNISSPIGWELRYSVFDEQGKRNLLTYCSTCHGQITRQEQLEQSSKIDHEELFKDKTKEFDI